MNVQRLFDRPGTITPLIAWLSTCLMAAGLGALIDPSTRVLWLRGGCFGLVAAAGLEGAVRTRARLGYARYQRALQKRCERSLQRFAAERDCEAERTAAIAQLLAGDAPAAEVTGDRRHEPRFACDLAVDVFPVRRGSASAYFGAANGRVAGRLANVSSSGFGLVLDEPIDRQLVVISLLPPRDQDFDLLGELLWCERDPSGQIRSGGRLLRVLSRCNLEQPDDDPQQLREPCIETAC